MPSIKITRDGENFIGPLTEMVSILHCTSNYPARDEAVNLNAILTLKKEFNLPIGYSDHTEELLFQLAVAIGAQFLKSTLLLIKICLDQTIGLQLMEML